MRGGQLIREARRRAGLSQADLAARLDTAQSAIARWEKGKVEPGFATVVRAVRACGFELTVGITEIDDSDDSLMAQLTTLSPRDRVAHHQRLLNTERRLATARPVDE